MASVTSLFYSFFFFFFFFVNYLAAVKILVSKLWSLAWQGKPRPNMTIGLFTLIIYKRDEIYSCGLIVVDFCCRSVLMSPSRADMIVPRTKRETTPPTRAPTAPADHCPTVV